ncbi:OLC1v1006897C1 [Oldenlandia corymbosa var. corymbosa]|uniref:OLC1v1006897C1 n=1 Tax=Oldenlandia corymbosa var. corymbosa TaxID=529605 RepID=A0AAV1DI60_OLDCO|nr:OLC1v1006897C1 [Oldenlandia corymbosa var. corymbosa]
MPVLCSSYTSSSGRSLVLKGQFHCCKDTKVYHRKPPKNLRYPRRTKLPPDSCLNGLSLVSSPFADDIIRDDDSFDSLAFDEDEDNVDDKLFEEGEENDEGNGGIVWEQDEIEAISSLFKGRVPQKPGSLERRRPLPLPLPYKKNPIGFPTQKVVSRKLVAPARQSLSNQVYKNPSFLVGLAKEIKALPLEEKNVSLVLDKWARFLRKGSLSMTIRELGHMGLPERALLVFCWAQKQPHLYPDDRILASTVEVLARSHELKMPFMLHKDHRFLNMVSQSVYEAIVKGFIKGGSLKIAWKLLSAARASNRLVDSEVYAKLILKLGKNPDREFLVTSLLEELAGREDLNLNRQDCTAIMKVCVRFGKFEIVEGLYDWFKRSGHVPSVVMYTTMIHSRYTEKRYREALAIVWEMEAAKCLFDLPAYRVVMKLFMGLNDLQRGARYFSKLKEAGFTPTFDIYMCIIQMYIESGRIAKCKEVWLEAEMAGFKLDEQIRSQLFELGN